MKSKTYYQIHKNKSPKRKVQKFNWKPIFSIISMATELVHAYKEMARALNEFKNVSKPIPKYGGVFKGGKVEILSPENYTEVILDKNGNNYALQNVDRNLKEFIIPKEFKDFITADDFIKSSEIDIKKAP